MKFNKKSVLLTVIIIALTSFFYRFAQDIQYQREKKRLETILSPVVTKATEGTPDPKPELFFVIQADRSLLVVLTWRQNPDVSVKNDMRERVLFAVRRELSTDTKSWGRHIAIIFNDEIVTQGWK